jgi:hypothetical protein
MWLWLAEHTSLLFYVGVGMVFLSVWVHCIRKTRYWESIQTSVQSKIAGIPGTLAALAFTGSITAILPVGLAWGAYWITQSQFQIPQHDAATFSLIVLDSFLIPSLLNSIVAQTMSSKTKSHKKIPPILDDSKG